MSWGLPLNKKFVGITCDSLSFKNICIDEEVEIPVEDHVGAFGSVRRYDVHKGIDLYANVGDPVFAVEDGVVCLIRPFTGIKVDCPWWLDTDAVNISGMSGVVVYGEIEVNPEFKVGDEIKQDDFLGNVKRVLKKDKGRPTSMLHLALHSHGVQSNGEWKIGKEKPKGLLDPTIYLIEAMLNKNTITKEIL